jgi:hypothetical protein
MTNNIDKHFVSHNKGTAAKYNMLPQACKTTGNQRKNAKNEAMRL